MSKTEMFAGHKDPLGFFGKLVCHDVRIHTAFEESLTKIAPNVYAELGFSLLRADATLIEVSDAIKEEI